MRLIGASAALMLLSVACGSEKKDTTPSAASTATVTATAAAARPSASPSAAPVVAGDPPGSLVTRRIEGIVNGVRLPDKYAIFGRKDIPNEAVEKDAPEVGPRFREYGRETGNYYVLMMDGQPRGTLSVSQYATADGARKEFDFGKGSPGPDDRLDTTGIGDSASGLRAMLGSGETKTPYYVVSFTRGRYYVVVIDAPPGGVGGPPDSALALARVVDDALKANPVP